MSGLAERAAGQDQDLDTAIGHARAAVTAVLHAPTGGEGSWLVAKARAALASLLEQRIALATERPDARDPAAVSAARADRNEAIAVTAALLYGLPPGDPAWPEVALTVARLSYDRYRDAWPGAEPPDTDDLDAACDLLLRAARPDEADERTARYLVLALRDRRRLLGSPADSAALVTWGRVLLTFPEAGGLGRGSLHNMLEAELLDRAGSGDRAAAWWIPRQRLPRGYAAGHRDADRARIGHQARAGPRERGQHGGQFRRGVGVQAGPGTRRGQVGGILHGRVRVQACAGEPAVRLQQAAAGQPGLRVVPLLVGPAADRLHVLPPQVQPAPQDHGLAPVEVGRGHRGEVTVAAVLAQHGGRLPEPGHAVRLAAGIRQRGVGRAQHPARAVQVADRAPQQAAAAAASASRPASRPRSASAAPSARTRRASPGEISSQTPGTARATKAGAKLKNDAVTTAAPAAPSGAARPAK